MGRNVAEFLVVIILLFRTALFAIGIGVAVIIVGLLWQPVAWSWGIPANMPGQITKALWDALIRPSPEFIHQRELNKEREDIRYQQEKAKLEQQKAALSDQTVRASGTDCPLYKGKALVPSEPWGFSTMGLQAHRYCVPVVTSGGRSDYVEPGLPSPLPDGGWTVDNPEYGQLRTVSVLVMASPQTHALIQRQPGIQLIDR